MDFFRHFIQLHLIRKSRHEGIGTSVYQYFVVDLKLKINRIVGPWGVACVCVGGGGIMSHDYLLSCVTLTHVLTH